MRNRAPFVRLPCVCIKFLTNLILSPKKNGVIAVVYHSIAEYIVRGSCLPFPPISPCFQVSRGTKLSLSKAVHPPSLARNYLSWVFSLALVEMTSFLLVRRATEITSKIIMTAVPGTVLCTCASPLRFIMNECLHRTGGRSKKATEKRHWRDHIPDSIAE